MKPMKYVVSIDQGTTGTTVLVLDEKLDIVGRGYQEFPQIYPQPGWVEHAPGAIWSSVEEALQVAVRQAGIDAGDIASIGITNQRETTLLWERESLEPAGNAIVWQDRRTADFCKQLKEQGKEPLFRERTGLVLDPYFSGTKLRYMLEQDSERRKRAEAGELAFGTVDSYLVARLTGGEVHITDVTNASRTLLFDIHEMAWSDELCDQLTIPRAILPEVKSSAEVYGKTRGVKGLPDGIPVAGIAGDQQAALFGQACFGAGDAKCTYGTGAFILMNTGDKPVASDKGLLTTVAWQLGAGNEKGQLRYALEGSAFIAGACVQWLRDGLEIIESAPQIEDLARSVPDSGGVAFVPAFAGLGAPHWRPEARASITGLTRGTTRGHLARAALEGIALQNYDILKAMESDSGKKLATLKVDGGASANDLLMEMQADILGVSISRPEIIETTALGAAFLAGLGAGVWSSVDDIAAVWKEDARFEPSSDRTAVDALLSRWNRAIANA
ncbi:MAG: glycerol kinase GlpK [Deltaproteobacteria bacterium]|nr:glycerol kinase GlpK [Deltaproteobacteria bacterium]